jgi:PAS domain S-box-containing protein
MLLASAALLLLYLGVGWCWVHRVLPLRPPSIVADLTSANIWLRAFLGQCVVCISIAALVSSLVNQAKRASESLRRSEQKFARAFMAGPEAVAISDVESGRFIDVNEGFQRLLGFTREEIVGRTSLELGIWPEARERQHSVDEIVAHGSTRELPRTLRKRDGTMIPCLLSAETIELDGRQCFVVSLHDVSERLRAERALRESEEKFSKAFHASAEAISISSAETGRFVDVNKGYETLTGLARGRVIGRTAVEVGMWRDPATRAPMMQKMVSEGSLRDYPIELQNSAGETLDVLLSAEFIELGGTPHMVAVARDVTAARRAELAIKESEERFRLLIQHAPDAIVLLDVATGRFIAANPAAETLFGRTQSQLCELSPLDVSPERQADGRLSSEVAPEKIRAAIAGARPRFEWLYERADGRILPCEVRLLRLPDPSRVLVRGSILDVSEQRRAEREAALLRAEGEAAIRKLNAELEQRVADRTAQLTSANAELESFSYSVSHDLRSPLRAIDGFSRALEEDYGSALGPEASDHLRRVRAAVQRMSELIDGLLQLSRATRVELKRERINLCELAREVETELRERQPERHVTLKLPPELWALADRTLSRIALENLLDNAWKYSRIREEAVVELGALPEPGPSGERIYFVRDNGAGFDMRYAAKLFTPFQRLHTKAEFEGTGIGLATVRRVVGRHGGRAWAESVVGERTIVYFTLSGAPT